MRDFFSNPILIGDWLLVQRPDQLEICSVLNTGRQYIWVKNANGKEFRIKYPEKHAAIIAKESMYPDMFNKLTEAFK